MRETALITDDLAKTTPLCKKGRRNMLRDTMVDGLALIVGHNKKTFCYIAPRLSSLGEKAQVIGTFPEIGTDRARDVARMLRREGQSEDGISGAELNAAPTFASVAHAYVEAITDRDFNKSVEADQKFVRRNFIDPKVNPFAEKPIDQVTEHDVAELIKILHARGPQLAVAGLAKLNTLFNWALRPYRRRHFNIASNPAAHPSARLFGLRKSCRTHFLSPGDLRVYLNAVEMLPNARERGLAHALVLTGLGGNNLLKMRWSELDLEGRLWTKAEVKRGIAFKLPLSDAMVDLLVGLRDSTGPDAGAFVFGRERPTIDMSRLKRRIDAAMEIVQCDMNMSPIRPWVFHDIRRTVHVALLNTGLDNEAAGVALGRGLSLKVLWGKRQHAGAIRVALNEHAQFLAAVKDGSQLDWRD